MKPNETPKKEKEKENQNSKKVVEDEKNPKKPQDIEKQSSSKNKEVNKIDFFLNAKVNKPSELLNFNAMPHFKSNIVHSYKNCKDPIKESSYYCFNCKRSVCPDCDIASHKDHLLIQRDNCLNYDSLFFNDIQNVIEEGINLDIKKEGIKSNINKSIEFLKNELEILRNLKLNEIDDMFKKIKENYVDLKNNCIKCKESIEKYYNINKKFFNIKNDEKIPKRDEDATDNTFCSNILEGNLINIFNTDELNKDIENTVFLMNFEIMNLCDNKNLQIIDLTNKIKSKITNISDTIDKKTLDVSNQIKTFLNFDSIINKFDDFYWDVKLRTEKYNEYISSFKDTLLDIIKRNGNLEKLKDLISLFDSKNKKGKDVLFNQEYFIKMNDITKEPQYPKKPSNNNNNTANVGNTGNTANTVNADGASNANNLIAKRLKKSGSRNKFLRTNNNVFKSNQFLLERKLKSINKRNNSSEKKYKSFRKKTEKNLKGMNSPSKLAINIGEYNFPKIKNDANPSPDPNNYLRTYSNANIHNTHNNNNQVIKYKKNDVVLSKRVIQRFFSYSIYEFYSKIFKLSLKELLLSEQQNNKNNDISNLDVNSLNSIFNRKKNILSNNSSSNILGKNVKNRKNIGALNQLNNVNSDNNNNNVYSVNLLSNYTDRYYITKEKAKPIPNTNTIQLFDVNTRKITKISAKLNKEEHGYSIFPFGCRHILIEQTLYIIGGSDQYGKPINVVLSYNISNNTLTRLPNLNENHSYHTVEYLDNYDCIILIGGQNSNCCEIMDVDSKKWIKLPSLIYPRANTNIYYNNVTNEVFVLFGMEGDMSEKPKYLDTIEVLELNDMVSGWIKVDYYKSIGLDFKEKYCITIPLTREKLLIYGCSGYRNIDRKLYAFFDMIKNQCIKLDQETIAFIKNEEKRIVSFDVALSKFI